MSPIFRWRIIRPAAGVVLLLGVRLLGAAPIKMARPEPWRPADLVCADGLSIRPADAPSAAYRTFFSGRLPSIFDLAPRLRVTSPPPPGELPHDPPPIWTYRKGNWVLAAGGSAAGTGAGLLALMKAADDPAACCLMGTGLILMVLGPRRRKKRDLERMRATRLPRSA